MSKSAEERKMAAEHIMRLSAQGLSIRQIHDETGYSRGKIQRILADEDNQTKIKVMAEMSSAIVAKHVPIAEDSEYKEVAKEIEVIPLDRYEYKATTLHVQQLFIDKALRNMRLSDRLESLAERLTEKAHAALDIEKDSKKPNMETMSYITRLTNILKPVVSSQTETAKIALSLIEVGLQSGEIAKYLESQED